MSLSELPMLGNLAWTPLPGIDEIEIFDRFNGVPTLGTFRARQAPEHLFWRAIGYLTEFSFWLYVPLTPSEVHHLETSDDTDLLRGVVHHAQQDRPATVAVALDNRLVFERGWELPAGLDQAGLVSAFLNHLIDLLSTALAHDLPPTRREVYERAEAAAKRLAAA